MKKALSVLVAIILTLCLCGAASAEGQTYLVGICQLVQHVALDAATQGFRDALTETPSPLTSRMPPATPTPAPPS